MAIATLPRNWHNATCFAMPFSIERYSKSMRQKLLFQGCNMFFLLEGPLRVIGMWCVCLLVWILLFAHHVPDKSQHDHALTACAPLTVNCSLEVEQWRPGRNNKQFYWNSTVLFTKHKRELQSARYTIQRVATYIWKRQFQTWISQDSVPHLHVRHPSFAQQANPNWQLNWNSTNLRSELCYWCEFPKATSFSEASKTYAREPTVNGLTSGSRSDNTLVARPKQHINRPCPDQHLQNIHQLSKPNFRSKREHHDLEQHNRSDVNRESTRLGVENRMCGRCGAGTSHNRQRKQLSLSNVNTHARFSGGGQCA